METLSDLIEKYFVNEKILIHKKVYLPKANFSSKMIKIPSGGTFFWNPIKMPFDFIETDKGYYFDFRQTIPQQVLFGIFIWPIIIFLFFYLIPNYIFRQSVSIYVPLLGTGIGIPYLILSYLSRNWIQNIWVIRKDWVNNVQDINGDHIINGNMPQVDPYLTNFLSVEDMKKRWFFYKIPGLASLTKFSINQGLNATLLRADFSIQYKDI